MTITKIEIFVLLVFLGAFSSTMLLTACSLQECKPTISFLTESENTTNKPTLSNYANRAVVGVKCNTREL